MIGQFNRQRENHTLKQTYRGSARIETESTGFLEAWNEGRKERKRRKCCLKNGRVVGVRRQQGLEEAGLERSAVYSLGVLVSENAGNYDREFSFREPRR